MTTYPIADPLRGKTVPDDGDFPTDDQVMTGASPQAGVKGGVSFYGSYYPATSPLTTLTAANTWTAIITISSVAQAPAAAPYFTDGGFLWFSGGDAANLRYVRFLTVTGGCDVAIRSTVAGVETLSGSFFIPTGAKASLAVVSVDGDWTVSAPGFGSVSLAASGTSWALAGTSRNGLGFGNVADFKFVNRALTADEIKACNKGEIPAELAKSGYTAYTSDSAWTGWSAAGAATISVSAGVLHLTAPTGDGMLGYGTGFTLPGDKVAKYRLKLVVDSVVTAGSLTFLASSGGTTYSPAVSVTTAGTYYLENIGGAGAPWLYATSAFEGYISSAVLERIGTVEHFAADQVTSTGRWIGKFGTSLIPGSGITPLDPQPVQVRMEQFRYDLATSTALDSPSGWALVKNATGELHITPPTYANATTRPIYTAVSQATQNVVDCSVNTTTGVAVLINRVTSTGTPSDATVQGHITYRE